MGELIDINADVGEGLGNEASLMPYLDSCNIACGGHAGDKDTIRKVVDLANNNGVKVGAHPSFPDKQNFGRLPMDITAADLYHCIKEQIRMFMGVLRETRTRINHVKPHGALYNMAAKDEKTARVVIEVIKSISNPIELYVPYNSVIAKLAVEEKVDIKFEAFADRNYNDDLSLVSRSKENAVIYDKELVLEHVLRMIHQGNVKTIGGKLKKIKAETICVHGDNPKALELLKFLSENLKKI